MRARPERFGIIPSASRFSSPVDINCQFVPLTTPTGRRRVYRRRSITPARRIAVIRSAQAESCLIRIFDQATGPDPSSRMAGCRVWTRDSGQSPRSAGLDIAARGLGGSTNDRFRRNLTFPLAAATGRIVLRASGRCRPTVSHSRRPSRTADSARSRHTDFGIARRRRL